GCGPAAVVVATMGQGDEHGALEAALTSQAGYVGLVASARRAATLVEALRARGLGEDALSRLRSPAGLDLGPCTQEEIGVAILAHARPPARLALGPGTQEELAVAILAELVTWRHAGGFARPAAAVEAVAPVCGMT